MPHKRNPITCERIAGLARLLRANAMAGLENVALWHERDISHSSAERVILPDSTILLDYMLHQFTRIVRELQVYPENMRRNLERTGGLIFSQQVLLALAQKGMTREEAYRHVQEHAMAVWTDLSPARGASFLEYLLGDKAIRKFLNETEIRQCFDLNKNLRHVDTIYQRLGLHAAA
jgi:adenylosuccinate lyase